MGQLYTVLTIIESEALEAMESLSLLLFIPTEAAFSKPFWHHIHYCQTG